MTKKQPWDPGRYTRFERQRAEPFFDLLKLVEPGAIRCVVDLGCGTGKLTSELHGTLAAETTVGLDSSEAMLARARTVSAPGLDFRNEKIEDFLDGDDAPFDLVFSNAALHWVSEHAELFAKLAKKVAPGGQLAVQVPAMETRPAHALARALVAEEPFASALGEPPWRSAVLSPDAYSRLLFEHGFERQHVRLQIYGHRLLRGGDVIEWMRGSLLTWYQARMDREHFDDFVRIYTDRLIDQLGVTAEEPLFYPYERILVWGRR